jgi:hypothetical protein
MIEYERLVKPEELTFWQRFKARFWGRTYAFSIPSQSEETKGELCNFYYAYCEKHGYFVSYEHGFEKEMHCPECVEEWLKEVRDELKLNAELNPT